MTIGDGVSRGRLVGTSWKMNLTSTQAMDYLAVLRGALPDVPAGAAFVLPPFTSIWVARDVLAGSPIAWGAQDVHPDDGGAHTGDVSAPMLADLGCRYVEVGHSERRRDHGEQPGLIAAKVAAILRWGMSPIICVGEDDRSTPDDALSGSLPDLEACLAEVPAGQLGRAIVAYEPHWAIGAGAAAAPPDYVSAVHQGVHAWLAGIAPGGADVPVIYGGSVDQEVAPLLAGLAGVDGLFVGRAALDPLVFARIVRVVLGSG